jgi:replicative DNA helicase
LQELGRVRVKEDMIVDVPELSYASSLRIVKDQGKGEDVARDDLGLKVAAREVELPVVCFSQYQRKAEAEVYLPVPAPL